MATKVEESLAIKLANAALESSSWEARWHEATQELNFYKSVLASDEALKSLFDEVAEKGEQA